MDVRNGRAIINNGATISGSSEITGSLNISGSVTATSFTGSFSGTASFAVSSSFASTASFLASTTNAFLQNGNSFGTQALIGTNDNQNLALETSGSIRMFISSSGFVGIGTTSPSFNFDVNGNARVQTNLTIGLTTNNGGSRTVFNGSTSGRSFHIANNWNAGNTFEITPSTTSAGSTFTTPALVVNGTTSNIGIGTTSPQSRLDVRAQGALSTDIAFRVRNSADTANLLQVNGLGGVEINSTTQGFLPPRMTTTQRNAIASPAAGLIVYDTTLNKLCVRTALAWETITSI